MRKFETVDEVKSVTAHEVINIIENQIGGLLDSIGEANHAYFKNGMKLGASLLLQLLGAWEEPTAVR